MSIKTVEAVWIWRFNKSAFKATYGRLSDSTYTKDFLQASGACAEVLETVFPKSLGRPIDLTLAWPTGTRSGRLLEAADYQDNGRLNLRWQTHHAPDPWRLNSNPGQGTVQTFPGNPNKSKPDEANAELAKLKNLNLDPYLVVVKLYGEPNTLHVRAYLGKPSPNLRHASIEQLPSVVQTTIGEMQANRACTALHLESDAPRVSRAPKVALAISQALRHSLNVLLIGPPGCGKTVALEDLRHSFERESSNVTFDASRLHDAWSAQSALSNRVRTVVFHLSYTYEEFVMGLYPVPNVGGGVELKLRSGPLLSLAHWASAPGNRSLMIIDEFNRGNPSAIFGDTLALLDQDQRSDPTSGRVGAVIDRSNAELPLDVPQDCVTSHGGSVGHQLGFPKTLSIVAAMNSSDRSVAPLDAALRRRFTIIRVDPDYELLAAHLQVDMSTPVAGENDINLLSPPDILRLGIEVLITINRRICHVLGADFELGHSVFWHVADQILRKHSNPFALRSTVVLSVQSGLRSLIETRH